MNLLTETGEALLVESGEGLGLDGFPLDPVARAQESFDMLTYLWTTRPPEGLTYTQGTKVLTVEQAPVLVVNGSAQAIGVEVVVSLTDNGSPVSIDGVRRVINPPLVPRSGVTEIFDGDGNRTSLILAWSVGSALFEAVMDSMP